MSSKARFSQRLCLLLAVMVMGQQFNVVLADSAVAMKKGLRARRPDKKTFKDWESNDNKDDKEISKQEKRGIHGVLFAASVATSLINLGLDILLKVKGCCVFYRSICRDTDEYNRRSRNLAKEMKAINQEWKRVVKLRDWIKNANDKNAEIWLEVKRIGDLQDRIVKVLDSAIIKGFNLKVDKLKKMVESGNQSVINMQYKEFDNIFQSSFTTVEDTALRLTGITSLLGVKIASFGFKHYKLAKITKTLRTSYGSKLLKAGPGAKKFFGFSKASMNLHLKQTSKSMYKASFAGTRAAKFMRGANSLMSVVSIAMDIYSIIKKIRACRAVRDKARNGVREIRKAEHDSKIMDKEIHAYKRALYYRGVHFVKTQLNSKDLHTVLASIRDLSQGASKQSPDLRSAAPVITRFLSEISGANNARTTYLQMQLISALKKVTVFLDCYLTKLKVAKYIQKYCEKGSDDIQALYNRANKLFNFNTPSCRTRNGFPYTTLDNVKALIETTANDKGFNTDCVLNSKYKHERACALSRDGYKIKQIASQMRLKKYQVKHFLKSCKPPKLTPGKLMQICAFRGLCAPEDKIATFTGISQARLLSIPCPCSEI